MRLCGLAIVLCGFASTLALADNGDSQERGKALYNGSVALSGKLQGHATPLPPHVLACRQCHAGTDKRGRDGRSLEAFAPLLGGGRLQEFLSRRNGPPGSYDRHSFCLTLRTGLDPQQIQLPLRMPRFDVSDSDCEDLWNYLNAPISAIPSLDRQRVPVVEP